MILVRGFHPEQGKTSTCQAPGTQSQRISQNRLGAGRQAPSGRGERRACPLHGRWPAASRKAQSFLMLAYLCGLPAWKQKTSFGCLLAFTSGIASASSFRGWCGPGVTYSTSSVEEKEVEASWPGPQLPPDEVSCLVEGGNWQAKPGVHVHLHNLSLFLKALQMSSSTYIFFSLSVKH